MVGREIRLIGTANIGQLPGYTTLESLPGTASKKPLTIGYYQNIHFTSLKEQSKNDLISCPECKEDFGCEGDLETHKKKYHTYDNILKDISDIPLKVTERKQQDLKDLYQEELLDSDTEYDPTMDSDSEEERDKPSKNQDTEKFMAEEESINCNICDSTFRWQSGLRAHIKSMHTGKFKCVQCQWSFESLEKLKDHMGYLHSENHESSQIVQEELMDSVTENDTTMDSDTETLLVEEGSIQCNICESTFHWQSELRAHLKSMHSVQIVEKPKCDECNWRFSNSAKLEKHIGMLHPAKNTEEELDENDQTEAIMSCNVCKKEFSKPSNLTRHITNIHEKNERKRKHQDTQETNKPLQCEYCQKSFKTKFNLKRHNLTHM